ncbi:MAG: hypothetical protein AB8B56_03525 [Crocinitomicaceae bacterium]
MFLKRKIPASSIAEVVIAVSVIALCIGIGSLVFVRSTKSTVNFQEVRTQTEVQSKLWKNLFKLENEITDIDNIKIERESTENDSIERLLFIGEDGKVILKQDWWVE